MLLDLLARPPSLVESVCQRLAGEIRSHGAAADSWLPTERELAAKMGVSRSVVREAAKRLEQQGLLEIRQGSGMRAVDRLHKPLNGSLELLLPDQAQRLRQLVEVRVMLEPEIARLAAERATNPQITELRAVHQRLVEAEGFESSVRADMEFHRHLAAICGNQVAALLLHSLSELLQASLSIGYQRVTPTNPIQEHQKILDAIVGRDGPAAAGAMARHLATASADLGFNESAPNAAK